MATLGPRTREKRVGMTTRGKYYLYTEPTQRMSEDARYILANPKAPRQGTAKRVRVKL